MTFSITVSPAGAVGPSVLPPASGRLPAIQLDRDGDRKVDRLIGRPKGKPAGIYAVAGRKVGKKLASARATADIGTGGVKWTLSSKQVVKSKKVRWRAVSRSVVAGSLDRIPDTGFRSSRWSRIGC